MKKLLITLVLLIFSSTLSFASDDDVNVYMIPRKAPTETFFDGYDKAHSLQDYESSFLVVVFWSRYCAPCLRELSSLNNFQNQAKDNGIKVILLSPESEWTNAVEEANMLKRYGATNIDHFLDRNGKLKQEFGIFTTPYAVLLNIKGQEIGRIKGSQSWDSNSFMEKIYKIKADSNEQLNKKPAPLMEIGGFKSQELPPVGD